jgi:hypothetical protein
MVEKDLEYRWRIKMFIMKTSLGTFDLTRAPFPALPRKLIYKIFVSTATTRSTSKGNTRKDKIVVVKVEATIYDDSDLAFFL